MQVTMQCQPSNLYAIKKGAYVNLNKLAIKVNELNASAAEARSQAQHWRLEGEAWEVEVYETINNFLKTLGYTTTPNNDGTMTLKHKGKVLERGYNYGLGEYDIQNDAFKHAGLLDTFRALLEKGADAV